MSKSTNTPATESKKTIVIADVKVKGITVTEKTSCTIFESANKVRWYLKGSTLEVTEISANLKDRITPYTKERLATGRCGKIIGTIKKVADTADLTSILANLVTAKATKVIKEEPKKETAPAPKTTAKKTTKKVVKADTTPAPVNEESAPAAKAA